MTDERPRFISFFFLQVIDFKFFRSSEFRGQPVSVEIYFPEPSYVQHALPRLLVFPLVYSNGISIQTDTLLLNYITFAEYIKYIVPIPTRMEPRKRKKKDLLELATSGGRSRN